LGVTHLLVKGLVYENDPHETLVSASFIDGLGKLGTKAVGGYGPYTLHKCDIRERTRGDLPNQLRWLRPFALAGAIAPEFPLTGKSKPLLFEPDRNQSHYGYLHSADVLHWAFAVEFSTLYLTSRFTGGPPKEEPLNRLVPRSSFRSIRLSRAAVSPAPRQ